MSGEEVRAGTFKGMRTRTHGRHEMHHREHRKPRPCRIAATSPWPAEPPFGLGGANGEATKRDEQDD